MLFQVVTVVDMGGMLVLCVWGSSACLCWLTVWQGRTLVGICLYRMMDSLVFFLAHGIGTQKLIVSFFLTMLSGSYFNTTSIRIRYGIWYRHNITLKYEDPVKLWFAYHSFGKCQCTLKCLLNCRVYITCELVFFGIDCLKIEMQVETHQGMCKKQVWSERTDSMKSWL
jgi:hypothetical protein